MAVRRGIHDMLGDFKGLADVDKDEYLRLLQEMCGPGGGETDPNEEVSADAGRWRRRSSRDEEPDNLEVRGNSRPSAEDRAFEEA